MKKLLDWVHIPGVHCGSVALRDVMQYHGYALSEPMCFGIGGGLGFYYSVMEERSPTRMIFMRGPEMEPTFFSIIDKPTEWSKERDNNRALGLAKEAIDNGYPLLLQTDIYYLDYYNSNTHFPGHIVAMWGYDDETGTVFISDTGFEGLKLVSYEDFMLGRSSKHSSNPLSNNWIDVNPQKPIVELRDAIPAALKENARKMTEGHGGARGESSVELIRTWAEDLPNWSLAQDWQWCARFGYQVIQKRGVGGGGFRYIYRDFLVEAEDIVPELKDLGLSGRMTEIADKWSNMGDQLKAISEKDTPKKELLLRASSLAHTIWEQEVDFYNTVRGL